MMKRELFKDAHKYARQSRVPVRLLPDVLKKIVTAHLNTSPEEEPETEEKRSSKISC